MFIVRKGQETCLTISAINQKQKKEEGEEREKEKEKNKAWRGMSYWIKTNISGIMS